MVTKDSDGTITKQVEYTYDAFDRRLSKSVDTDGEGIAEPEEEHFLYDRDHIALVFDEGGNLTHRYLHGPQVDQVLAEETGGGVRWALSDHQGTVRDVVNGDGEVLNHLTYDSFGEATDETNPEVEFRFGYTGREIDPETDLNYYRARYYDPQVGQFISEDPLGFAAGDANLYRYVGNSPTNGTDPYGLQTAYGDDLIPWWATPLVWFGSGLVWVGQQLGDAVFDLFENDSITVDPELAELFDPNNINRGEFEIATDLQLPGFGEDSLDFNPNEINLPNEIPDFSDTETFPNSCPALESPPFFETNEQQKREQELRIDDYLRSLGENVQDNPLEGQAGAGRQGDRYVNGKPTEYKTLRPGARPNTIKGRINDSLRREGQARNIILDARGTGLTEAEAMEGLRKARGISRGKLDSARVIGDDFDVKIEVSR